MLYYIKPLFIFFFAENMGKERIPNERKRAIVKSELSESDYDEPHVKSELSDSDDNESRVTERKSAKRKRPRRKSRKSIVLVKSEMLTDSSSESTDIEDY